MMDPNDADSVLGHYSVLGNSLQPLLAESSSLFKAVIEDDAAHVAALGAALESEATRMHNVLHWTTVDDQPSSNGGAGEVGEAPRKPLVSVRRRTLVMLASYHASSTGSLRVLKLLLGLKNVDPRQQSADGSTAFTMAKQACGSSEAEVLALLQAASDTSVLQPTVSAQHGNAASLTNSASSGRLDPALFASGLVPGGASAVELATFSHDGTLGAPSSASDHESTAAAGFPISVDLQHHLSLHQQDVEVDPFNTEGLPYSTSELTQPEYSTDDFRMFAFKVLRCSKRFAHDWRACPFAHPTENARRRDPREFRYCAVACPDYKQGFCVRGDMCPYAHGVFEAWLHPSRYRTQLCKDGANCHRPICFFAHSLPELRTPTHTWTPGADDAVVPTPPPAHANGAGLDPALHTGQQQGGRQPGGTKQGPRQGPGGYPQQGGNGVHHHHHGGKPNSNMPYGEMHAGHAHAHVPPPPPQKVGALEAGIVSANGATAPGAASPSSGSVAAAMFGFTAPRMSNAFARRHGLNPKDNAMLNLQKIALQAQPGSAAGEHLGRLFHNGGGGGHQGMGGGGQQEYQQQQPGGGGYGGRMMGMGQQHPMMMQQGGGRGKGGYGNGLQQGMGQGGGSPMMMQQGYGYPQPNGLLAMQAVAAAASHDPTALAALNHHLASLSIAPHHTAASAAAAYAASQGVGMGLGFNGMGNTGGYNSHRDGMMASGR